MLLHFSMAVSRLSDQNKVLAQRVALLQQRLEEEAGEGGRPDLDGEDGAADRPRDEPVPDSLTATARPVGGQPPQSAPLCLAYLAWTPYGIEAAERFLDSYRKHEAGAEHRLVLALAGPAGDREPWRRLFGTVEHEELALGEGMDLDHYRAVVDRVVAERYCFVNTVSVVLADGWLGHLERALLAPGVGMVASTGSYESPNAVRPGPLRRLRPGHRPFRTRTCAPTASPCGAGCCWSSTGRPGSTKLGAVALEGGTHGLTRQVRSGG